MKIADVDLENGYRVEFKPAPSYNWFYTTVYFQDTFVGEKAVCRSWTLAVWWARRKIRQHRRAMLKLTRHPA